MGTRYFENTSTYSTFTATLLKEYRRYFICHIFEKVPTVRYSVAVLGTVIGHFSKGKFYSFGNNAFGDFKRRTMIESLICVVVTGITCSVNKSMAKITSKKLIFIILAV